MDQAMAAPFGIIMILLVLGIFSLVLFIPTIFYLLTLQKALERCHPRNRMMQPGLGCWIIYWMKIAEYARNLLFQSPENGIPPAAE